MPYLGKDCTVIGIVFSSLSTFLSPVLLVGSARSASKPPAPRRHHPAARLARLGKGRPSGLTSFLVRDESMAATLTQHR